MIPVVYTAGPFTASTPWDIERNVMAMREIALAVAKCGAMPICPHANTSLFHGQCTEQFWYIGTMELLKRCDAIVMHPSWQSSKGSREEHLLATEKHLPIFYYKFTKGLKNSGLEEWVNYWMKRALGNVRPSACTHDPRELKGAPMGMYHCPGCGEMVLAGCEHPGVLEE